MAEARQEEGHKLRVALQRGFRQTARRARMHNTTRRPRGEDKLYFALEQVPEDRCCLLTKHDSDVVLVALDQLKLQKITIRAGCAPRWL